MALHPFPTDAKLTAIALAYKNPDVALIADDVLPRTRTEQKFKWREYDLAEGFTVPNTLVHRKSVPAEVEFTGAERGDYVLDYGLDDVIPNEDIEAGSRQGWDCEAQAVSQLANLVNLGRESRVAALVFNAASYNPRAVTTLSGESQWSHDNSNPVAVIGDALDIPVIRPNIAILGQTTWTKLRRNPRLVRAIRGTSQDAGQITREEFVQFFELQDLYVGAGYINQARRGQDPALARVWGNHAAFIYRDRTAGSQSGLTFGFTAQWGEKIAGRMDEPKVGLTGAVRVRVGERVKEIVCAKDLGVFFQNAVA